MNLFGLEIKFNGKSKCVKQSDCDTAKRTFNQRIDDLKGHIDTRFDDFKDFLRNPK